jgi:type VI secretion system protein VasD
VVSRASRPAALSLASLLAALALAGCGKSPIVLARPTPATSPLTISVSADTNPDANGRPSPVVLRVYQLKADDAFVNAEFFPLFDDDMKVLGPSLVSRDEYVLAPAEHRSVEVAVSGDTKFLGAVAAFRDIRNAEWRVLVPVTRKGLNVAVERSRVVLAVAQ